MAATQINDGSNTTGLTTVDSNGFTSNGSILGSANYGSISAVSVGSSVGGADAGCSIWGKLAGISDRSGAVTNHFLYWMMDSSTAFAAGNGYVAKITIETSAAVDYITIYKRVSGVDTALTPHTGPFSDTTNKRFLFKRGQLASGDSIGIIQGDNEHWVYMHDADEGDFLPIGKVVDSTKTTAGHCGLGLGTNSTGKWDDVWSGSVPVKWVHVGTGSDGAAGSKAAPWGTWKYALANMTAGGFLFMRTATFSQAVRDGDTGFSKGTNNYNPSIITGYNSESVINNNTSGSPTLNFGGGASDNMANARIVLAYMSFDGQGAHGGQPGVQMTAGCSRIRLFCVKSYDHGVDGNSAVGFQDSIHNDPVTGRLTDYDVWYIGCESYDNAFSHGFYIIRSGITIEWCNIYDNGGMGISLQPLPTSGESSQSRGQGNIIRGNRVWGNGYRPAVGQAGIILSFQDGVHCYNNLVYHNAEGGILLDGRTTWDDGITGALIYNNTVWKNGLTGKTSAYKIGIYGNDDQGGSNADPVNNEIKNNIVYGNFTNTISLGVHFDSSNVVSNNLFTYDSYFTDPDNATRASADFSIVANDDQPVDGNTADTSSVVKYDFVGIKRPQINKVDYGAYEFPGAANPPSDPVISAPGTIAVTVNTNKLLSSITIEDQNDPDVGNYTVRIVVKTGTLNDGV